MSSGKYASEQDFSERSAPVRKQNGRHTQTRQWAARERGAVLWSRFQVFGRGSRLIPAASEVTDCECYLATGKRSRRQTCTTKTLSKWQIFAFFSTVEQKVVVTRSWPAMRAKSSNWSSATSWQQKEPLIIIKRGLIWFIGPCRIFSKLLLNSKHQAAARKSSCVSFLRLEAKCFTV